MDDYVFELGAVVEITWWEFIVSCTLVGFKVEGEPADNGMFGLDVDEGHGVLGYLEGMLLLGTAW